MGAAHDVIDEARVVIIGAVSSAVRRPIIWLKPE